MTSRKVRPFTLIAISILIYCASTLLVAAQSGGVVIERNASALAEPTPTASPSVEPLIFIPGIAGSRLTKVEADGRRSTQWPVLAPFGLSQVEASLTLDPSRPRANIIASDVVREVRLVAFGSEIFHRDIYKPLLERLVAAGYREYQVNRDPSRRTTGGCDLTQQSNNPNLFVFAYDWRKSNVENARLLRDYVGCVRRFYPDSNVNILAHSMGGLLARRYILENSGGHHVNKMITIGSPWLGAPKGIYVLETGNFFDEILDRFFAPTMKRLVEFFPGAHELLPSQSYFDLGGRPFGEAVGDRNWDINRNGRPDATYNSYGQVVDVLNRQHPRSRPGDVGRAFHNYAGQDDWRDDRTGVEYFHIYGIQSVRGTVGKVIAVTEQDCEPSGANCRPVNFFRTENVQGDGTVPLLDIIWNKRHQQNQTNQEFLVVDDK